MDKNDLLKLINDDDLGLLDIDKKSAPITPDDRLLESFIEVNDFYKLHKLEPKSGGDIYEHKLASRLKHIRENKEQRDMNIFSNAYWRRHSPEDRVIREIPENKNTNK